MNTLKFEFTIDETNLVLSALAKAPYEQVAGLIAKLREQAAPQVQPPPPQVQSSPGESVG